MNYLKNNLHIFRGFENMDKLKTLRKEKKLTQGQIAEILNTTQTCYNYYETGKREPSVDTLCKLADYYHVTLDYLVGRKFVLDIGYLSDEQKEIVKLIQRLDDTSLQPVKALLQGMVDNL